MTFHSMWKFEEECGVSIACNTMQCGAYCLLDQAVGWSHIVSEPDQSRRGKKLSQSGISMVFQHFFVRVHVPVCMKYTYYNIRIEAPVLCSSVKIDYTHHLCFISNQVRLEQHRCHVPSKPEPVTMVFPYYPGKMKTNVVFFKW